tara:strand:+ start:1757 stop:2353 length:597 start_codon:yes stop_codon:yes gene_type:complete
MASVVISGDTSGTVTLAAPAVSGTTTLTLPTTSGTVLTSASTILTSQLSGSIASSSLPAGSVLQVVNTVYSTSTSTVSNTLIDTGLQAIITPTSASNKIFIMYTVPVVKATGEVSNGVSLGVTRNGSIVGDTFWLSYGAWTGSSANNRAGYSATLLDSPSSTSALTYKLRFCETYGSAGVTVCHDGSYATMTLMEIKG